MNTSKEKNVYSESDFAGKMKEAYKKYREELKRPNILICGGTGAGKSTLINMTFDDGKLHAEAGAGRPVTQEVAKYEGEFVILYDSPGYESGQSSQEKYREIVNKLILENKESAEKRIHMVWYCINQARNRIFDVDIQTINDIRKKNVPVAVVLTQADIVDQDSFHELKAVLEKDCPGVDIFETSNNPELHLGVQPLLDWSTEHLDDSLRETFIVATKQSIERKSAEGRRITLEHVAAAGTIAALPIPFSDAPLLVSNQVALLVRLFHLWNVPHFNNIIVNIITESVVSHAGKSLVSSLLKLIPGPGTVAGGIINASVASAITAGIGYGTNECLAMMKKDELEGKESDISKYLSQLSNLIDMSKREYERSQS